MSHDRIIQLPLTEKCKLWMFAIYFAFVIYVRNLIYSIWKTPIENDYRNKPLPNVVSNGLGNHMYIKINGVKLHYVERGDTGSPVLLLLHGFPDCWFGWRHQIKILSKSFRVIAVDLKGFGDSEKPQWRHSYNIPIVINELAELVQSIGNVPCLLVGHDVGALLGWILAAQYPSLVKKFVSIACPHPNVYWDHLSNAGAINSRFIQLCQVPYLPESLFRRDNIAMIDLYYKHLHKSREASLVDSYKYVFSREEDISGPMHYLRNLLLTRLTDCKLTVPTLLLVGSRDPFIAVEDFIRSTAYLESFEIMIVENGGHFPHQEETSRVNELLLAFLCDPPVLEENEVKTENPRGILGNLVTNTLKYGNSLVHNVKKTTNGVWPPQLLKTSS